MSIFDGCREDWEADINQYNRHIADDISGDQTRVVLDELVVPGVDPYETPETIPWAILGLLAVIFTAISLVMLCAAVVM